MARCSFDSNILIYAFDPGEGERHVRARDLVRRGGLADVILTQQVIGEFLNVGCRRKLIAAEAVDAAARSLMSIFPPAATPPAALLEAFERARRYRLQFWDAVIITVCLANAVEYLLSEDMQDGMVIDGLTIVDPFRTANNPLVAELLQPLGS